MGFARMIAIKGVNYQEHVTEYGTHWNFFFTLGVVALFSTLINSIFPTPKTPILAPIYSATFGVFIILVYQAWLSWYEGADYIINAPRTNLFNANKEGIFGSLGYLSLYLIGVQLGAVIFQPQKRLRHWWMKLAILLVIDGMLWWLTEYLHYHTSSDAQISRRMVNLAYVVWILALNLLLLCVFLASHLALGSLTLIGSPLAQISPSFLALAINHNPLPFFLLANLVTGLINLSMQTVYAPSVTAIIVIVLYILFVYGIAGLLYYYKVSLKFW